MLFISVVVIIVCIPLIEFNNKFCLLGSNSLITSSSKTIGYSPISDLIISISESLSDIAVVLC